ncbi:hypothetical protein RHMOL_Rhmol04G0245800 [Rhododendron molle]|uniref:Uncharacterized protein n=1 Tax=Rhododendron molle TaxID=49168 RepID=A0ACC0P5A1_RHOML|nr:hypothetical protein RHMOL_Rhmol04G0245800 [Rhododendron molle]
MNTSTGIYRQRPKPLQDPSYHGQACLRESVTALSVHGPVVALFVRRPATALSLRGPVVPYLLAVITRLNIRIEAGTVKSLLRPFVELVKLFNLPGWLVHWGHPGNMAVVLFAMGGYGTYLGFWIQFSDDVEEKAKAKDLHPKLLAGMFFFFALGANSGVTSLLTSDKPIFERCLISF